MNRTNEIELQIAFGEINSPRLEVHNDAATPPLLLPSLQGRPIQSALVHIGDMFAAKGSSATRIT
jgi:hypothetical protein